MTREELLNSGGIKKLLRLNILRPSIVDKRDFVIVSKSTILVENKQYPMVWNKSTKHFTKFVNSITDVYKAYALEMAGEND